MKILVLGASGRIGSLVVQQLLKQGHNVHALVRSSASLPEHPLLTSVEGDVRKQTDITHALQGCDAVVSALSSWGTPTKDILQTAMQNIVSSPQGSTIRVVSLTGADARAPGDTPNIVQRSMHFFLGNMAKKVLQDGEKHIAVLAGANNNWSVLRSPVMNNKGKNGSYRLSNKLPMPWQTIHRHDVATAMVSLLEQNTHICQAPVIYRS